MTRAASRPTVIIIVGALCSAAAGCATWDKVVGKKKPVVVEAPPELTPAQKAGGKIACYRAETIYRQRVGKNAPAQFLGYTTLEGPLACPAQDDHPELMAPVQPAAHVLTVAPGKTWDTSEVDPDSPKNKVHFKYTSFTQTFAEKLHPEDPSFFVPSHVWLRKSAVGSDVPADTFKLCNPPTKPKLADAGLQLIWTRYFQRRNLVVRRVPFTGGNNPIERLPVDDAIVSCFEKMAAKDWCGAEAAGALAVSRDPNVSEGWFCQAFNHLTQDAKGSCHSPTGK